MLWQVICLDTKGTARPRECDPRSKRRWRVPRRAKREPKSHSIHLLDTNVILRFLIGDDPAKASRAILLMESVEQGREIVEISEALLTETVWTLQKFYNVPRPSIAQNLIRL